MTWRERIAAARERGYWTDTDLADMTHFHTCMAAEAVKNLGIPVGNFRKAPGWESVWDIGTKAWAEIHDGSLDVEHYLDQIEDEALRLKRGLPSSEPAA